MAWTRREADAQSSAAAPTPPPSFGRSPAGEAAWTAEDEPAYSWFAPPQTEAREAETSDRFEDTNQFRAIKPSDSFPPFQPSGTPPVPHHDGLDAAEGTAFTPEPGPETTARLRSAPGIAPVPETAPGPGITPAPEAAPAPGITPYAAGPGGHTPSPSAAQGAFAPQPEDPHHQPEQLWPADTWRDDGWSGGGTAQGPATAQDPATTQDPGATRDVFRAGEAVDAGAHPVQPADPYALPAEPGGHGDWPPPWTPPPNLEDHSRPWSPDPGVSASDDTPYREGSWPARHAAWPTPAPETYGTSQPTPAPEAYTPAHGASETYGTALPYDLVDPGDPLGHGRHADGATTATPANDAPAPDASGLDIPVSGAPVFGAPVYDTSRHDLPGQDVVDIPVLDTPVAGAPRHDVAAHGRSGRDDLAFGAPVLGAPVYDAPFLTAPDHGTSGDVFDLDGAPQGGDPSGEAGEHADGAESASARPAEPGDVPVWPPRLTGDEALAEGRHLHHEAPPVEHDAAVIEVADARTVWPLGSSAVRPDVPAAEQPAPVDPADFRTGGYEPLSEATLPAGLAAGAPSGPASDEALTGPARHEAPSGALDPWGSGGGEGTPTGTVRSLWPRLENDPSESGQGPDEAIALAITPTSGFPPPETGLHALPIEEPSGARPPQTPTPHTTPGHMPPAPTPQNPASAPTTPFAFTPVTPPKAAMKSLPAGFDSLGATPEFDADGPATTPQPKVPVLPGPPPDLPPVSQDDRGRPASGMSKRLLLAAAGAVVIAGIGAAAFYAYTGQPTTGTTTAAPAAAPSAAGTPDVAEAPSPKPAAATILDSQKTDPRKMSLTEAFPVSRVTVGGRAYRRVKVGSTDTCGQAAGGAFAVALQKQKCSRVLRATYVDSKKQFAVTTGIAVLPTKQAALTVDQSKNLGGNQWFRGLDGTAETSTDRVTISGGYAAGMVWGRYIVFSYATYADGHTPDLKDKSLGPVSSAFRDHTAQVLEKRLTS
ncbi:hypothetical protein [Planotetraspora kaengkrachanensis]|nr:hypothetical protein [Planotetraspora kaengkrachanensis]